MFDENNILKVTLPETNSSPLRMGRAPKRKVRLPTIHVQGLLLAVSFKEGTLVGVQPVFPRKSGRPVAWIPGLPGNLPWLPSLGELK